MSSSHGAPVAGVAHAAPEVDHLLAAAVHGTGRAQLARARRSSARTPPARLEPGRDEAVDQGLLRERGVDRHPARIYSAPPR